MAFPTTGIIDNLTGASWDSANNTLDPFNASRDTAPTPYSGVGIGTPSAGGYAFEFFRHVATYGPDAECYVSFPTVGAGFLVRLIARLKDPSSTVGTGDAYIVQGSPGATTTIYRILNTAVDATLGSYTMSASATGLGIEVTGSGATVTIKIYEKVSGVWQLGTTVTDTSANRIVTIGYVGVLGADTAGASRFTGFGGGTYNPTTTVAIGQVTTTTTAQPVTYVPPVIPVGQVTETTTAQAVTPFYNQTGTVGQATETTTAQPVTSLQSSNTQAQGGLAWLFHRGKIPGLGGVIGQATQTTTARSISSVQTVGQASSSTLARPVILAGSVTLKVRRDTAGRLLTGKPSPGRLLTGKVVAGRLLDKNTV